MIEQEIRGRLFDPEKEKLRGKQYPKILHNRIRCKRCGDVIESHHVHDFVYCSCGSCAVDGGNSYLKRAWDGKVTNPDEVWEELSEFEEEE